MRYINQGGATQSGKIADECGFTLANEEPGLYLGWAQKIKPRYCLAVLGGGEVPLMSLLPLGCEVVAVDLSARSCTAALLKARLLEEYGPKGLKRLLRRGKKYFEEAVEKRFEELPKTLLEELDFRGYELLRRHFEWSYARYASIWTDASEAALEAARRNLENLVIVRGNICRFEDCGFDLLYISNAVEWSSGLTGEQVAAIVKKGGHVMSSRAVGDSRMSVRESFDDKETSHRWNYRLYERIS